MVRVKRTKKYITRIGQYTGMSNASQNVEKNAMRLARVADSLRYERLVVRLSCIPKLRKRNKPEIPLRKASDEWSKLIILLRRERRHIFRATLLDFVSLEIRLERGIKFGLQECKEQV